MTDKLPPLDARIPQWDHGDLVPRDCPVCSSTEADTAYERPDGLIVRLCGRCTGYFVSPAPSADQLTAFYENYDDRHRRVPAVDPRELKALYDDTGPADDVRLRELRSHIMFKDKRMLDIGFGRAQFLYHMKQEGGIPYGLDVDPRAIECARALGIDNLFWGTVDDFITDTKFDMVTLLDVVEHPLNPMDLLRKSAQFLLPGGLLVLWTPNGDYGRSERHPVTFRVDLEHMQYLTPDSSIYIASALNLSIVHLETLGFPSLDGIDKPLSEYRDRLKPHPLRKLLKTVPGFRTVNRLRRKFFTAEPDERSGSYHLFCIMRNAG